MPICFPWLQYGSAQTPHEHRHSLSSATCKATGSSLHPCPAPTEALPAHPNPIALPHPPRQRLPSNGPIKTAPRKISANPCLIERGSPDRVLSFARNIFSKALHRRCNKMLHVSTSPLSARFLRCGRIRYLAHGTFASSSTRLESNPRLAAWRTRNSSPRDESRQ